LQLRLRGKIASVLAQALHGADCDQNGWAEVVSFPLAIKLVSSVNAITFFGLELESNPKFIQAAVQYSEELFITAEILCCLPTV
jgi:hypothetical protein